MRKLFIKIVLMVSMIAAVPFLAHGAIGKHLIEAKSKLPVLSYKVISGQAKNGQWIVLESRKMFEINASAVSAKNCYI